MKIEIRADGPHIMGYVNAVLRESRPVKTPSGIYVIETIQPGTFREALRVANNVDLTVDHKPTVYACTKNGTLSLYEDNIGLFADALIADRELIATARNNKIKGWSFGFSVNRDSIEPAPPGETYPRRRVSGINLYHVSLIVNSIPAYTATSIELRPGLTDSNSTKLTTAPKSERGKILCELEVLQKEIELETLRMNCVQ